MERVSHYEIVRRLGQGGMGEVHEAVDLDLGRRVAIKFLAPHLASEPEALRRLEREARVAAALQHPHIATVFAFDRSTERPFIVMELLGGRTLRELLAAGPMDPADALGLARPVADALAYAHRRDVAHRDIKPENLMFDGEGVIKITDFGLARAADATRLTRTGSTLGTPSYMAPELVSGTAPAEADEPAGAAPADVFALGVTLYEMLAGELPFQGQSALSTLYLIANSAPRPLRQLRPGLPAEVEALVARMLEKDPATRATAAEAAASLAGLAGAPPAFRPVVAAGATAAAATTSAVTLAAERVPARAGEPALPVRAAAGARPRGPRARLAALLAAVAVASAFVAWGLGAGRDAARRRAVALNNEGHDSLVAGREGAARERFEAALGLAPRYAEAKLNLAGVLARGGDANRAAALYGEVLRENPRRGELLAAAHYGLGELDLQARAWPSAIAHLGDASRLDSARAEYPNNLAFALVQAGRTDEALAALREARARFPAEPALLKNAALAWFAAGRLDSALAAAVQSVRLRPSYVAGWLARLECEAALGDAAAARASLEALRRLGADAATIRQAEAALSAGAGPRGGRPAP